LTFHSFNARLSLSFSFFFFQNIRGLYALLIKTFHHEDTLERLIQKSKILKERKADPWLIRILITELLFGKKCLSGDSKPVKAVLSHHQMFLAELKEAEKAGTVTLDSYQKRGNKMILNSFSFCTFTDVVLLC
jgi:hypothetical protein